MQLLSRREYNLILRSLDKYDLYMNAKEKELREQLEDKLYALKEGNIGHVYWGGYHFNNNMPN